MSQEPSAPRTAVAAEPARASMASRASSPGGKLSDGWRTLITIWFGQFVSIFGSGISGFALGVWVFDQSRSATAFSFLIFITSLPAILATPFTGVLVDRWDRRFSMLLGDTVAAISTVILLALVWNNGLQMWHLYVLIAVGGLFGSLQQPAFSATVPLLIPKDQLGRAAGISQMVFSAPQIVTPVLGGFLYSQIYLHGILMIDLATFLVAVVTLFMVRFPKPPKSALGAEVDRGSFKEQALFGWTYTRERKGLFALMLLFAMSNFCSGMAYVLFTPLVLTIGGPEQLGIVMGAGGAGFLIGSTLMAAWGGPERKIFGVLGGVMLQGLMLFLSVLQPTTLGISILVLVFMAASMVVGGCSQAIWQVKVEPDLQGRVFAIRKIVAWSTLPLAQLLGGPLADYVFEPWMREGGFFAETVVGEIMGIGPGRGIALLFIFLGAFTVVTAAVGMSHVRLRRVDLELPDAFDDLPPGMVVSSMEPPAGEPKGAAESSAVEPPRH